MEQLISRTYAGALFDLASEIGSEEVYAQELAGLDAVFRANPDLMKILKSPVSSKDDKKSLLSSIFAERVSAEVMNFLKILVDKGRIAHFEEIAESYRKLLRESRNVEEVTAVTAVPMSEEMKNRLSEKLGMQTGKTIILKNEVDEKVMGGVLLKISGRQIDSTVRTRLAELRNELLSMIAG